MGNVNLQDLCFYFDAQAKDRIDQGYLGRKTGQVLALRERLLAMPEPEFDAAMRTIEKLVANPVGRDAEQRDFANRRRGAKELYERAQVQPTEEIRKI